MCSVVRLAINTGTATSSVSCVLSTSPHAHPTLLANQLPFSLCRKTDVLNVLLLDWQTRGHRFPEIVARSYVNLIRLVVLQSPAEVAQDLQLLVNFLAASYPAKKMRVGTGNVLL